MPVSSLTCTTACRGLARCRQAAHEALAPGDDVGARGERDLELLGRQRAHHEHRPLDPGLAQPARLLGRRDREPARAAGLRRARGGDHPVPVAVGLDHGAQRRGAGHRREPRRVALDRAQIDPGQRPQSHCYSGATTGSRLSRHPAQLPRAAGSARMTSEAMTPSGPSGAAAIWPARRCA